MQFLKIFLKCLYLVVNIVVNVSYPPQDLSVVSVARNDCAMAPVAEPARMDPVKCIRKENACGTGSISGQSGCIG